MDCWTDHFCTKSNFMLTNKVRLPVELHPETYQNLPGCADSFRMIIYFKCYRLFHNEMLKEQFV